MRARQINDAGLDELASRFADQGFASRQPTDPADGVPVDSVPEAAIANRQECSLTEYAALEAATRTGILVRLDAWRAEDQRIKTDIAEIKAPLRLKTIINPC
jgi:hypothetical protein